MPAPAREVRFALWGVEIDSTRQYLADDKPENPCLGVINYDQAGFGSGADQLNLEPDDLPANKAMIELMCGLLSEFGGFVIVLVGTAT